MTYKKPWIEVHRGNLLHNLSTLKKVILPNQEIIPVLKANAYGHGLIEVYSIIHKELSIIALFLIDDAVKIREYEIKENLTKKRIIVFGPMTREGLELCIKHDVDVCIDNTIWQEKLKGLEIPSNKKLNVHIFIDTGLSREGFIFENIEMINFVNEFKEKISIKGFLSHLADGEDEDLTETQYECFHSCYKELIKVLGLSARDMIVQISASAGLLNKPYIDSTHFRVGLSIYGHYPSENSKKVFTEKFKRQLKPVLSLKSPSQLIKLLPKNRKVSYSGTYICKNDTKIALFPIGYFDGYPRLLSQKSHVLINDALCPILGNIAMNHIIVDISMLERHDSELTATLIGKSAFHEIKVEELAKHTRTINYEILARLGEHLERRII